MLRHTDCREAVGSEAGPSHKSIGRAKPPFAVLVRRLNPDALSDRATRLIRISANLIGACGAAFFAQATLQSYLKTHRLIGAVFLPSRCGS
jgi:hypothetical protein